MPTFRLTRRFFIILGAVIVLAIAVGVIRSGGSDDPVPRADAPTRTSPEENETSEPTTPELDSPDEGGGDNLDSGSGGERAGNTNPTSSPAPPKKRPDAVDALGGGAKTPVQSTVTDPFVDYGSVSWPDERKAARSAISVATAIAEIDSRTWPRVKRSLAGVASPRFLESVDGTFISQRSVGPRPRGSVSSLQLMDDPQTGARMALATIVISYPGQPDIMQDLELELAPDLPRVIAAR